MAYILCAKDFLHVRLDNPIECDLRTTTRGTQNTEARHNDGEAASWSATLSDLQHEDDIGYSEWKKRGSAESRNGMVDTGRMASGTEVAHDRYLPR